MTADIKPIRSESARFLVGGTRKGQGVVLLYPDKLVSVRMQAELWGCFVGAIAMAAATHGGRDPVRVPRENGLLAGRHRQRPGRARP
jgi:hypothetical protein